MDLPNLVFPKLCMFGFAASCLLYVFTHTYRLLNDGNTETEWEEVTTRAKFQLHLLKMHQSKAEYIPSADEIVYKV